MGSERRRADPTYNMHVERAYNDTLVKALAAVLKVDPTCVSWSVKVVKLRLGNDKGLRSSASVGSHRAGPSFVVCRVGQPGQVS